jgi:DNA-binding transcriptional MerR regulator
VLSSGDFSKVTGLSVKALRLYHDVGILVPRLVDAETGYRYYDDANVERARVIVLLKQMLLPIEDIKDLLDRCGDDGDAVSFLENQRTLLDARIRELKVARSALDRIVEDERRTMALLASGAFAVEEKTLPPQLVAGIRISGCYEEIGRAFGTLGRALGRHVSGKSLGLFYDEEYKDDGADFEACMPLARTPAKLPPSATSGITCRTLAGARAVTLVHRGPYSQIGRAYAKVLAYAGERGYEVQRPTREVYLKGPGIIFKGRPQGYLTEIQVPIADHVVATSSSSQLLGGRSPSVRPAK